MLGAIAAMAAAGAEGLATFAASLPVCAGSDLAPWAATGRLAMQSMVSKDMKMQPLMDLIKSCSLRIDCVITFQSLSWFVAVKVTPCSMGLESGFARPFA